MWRIQSDGLVVDLGEGSEHTVWVPSHDIVFHRTPLPTQSRKIWQQTAPFALEDEIIGAIAEYHFALSNQADAEGNVTIATVPVSLMTRWLESLTATGMTRVFLPDIFAVPYEGAPTLWHENDECLLRLGERDGVAGSPQWINAIYELTDVKGKLRVFSNDGDALPPEWQALVEPLPCSLEDYMRQSVVKPDADMNLLQGDYAPISAVNIWLGAWKRAGIAAGVLMALYLGHLMSDAKDLRAHTELLNRASSQLLSGTGIPENMPLSAIRTRIQSQIAKVRSAEQEQSAGMWSLILSMEPLLSSCISCIVESLDFNRSQVILMVSASDLRKFEEGLQGLSQARYRRTDMPGDDERERARFNIRLSGAKT